MTTARDIIKAAYRKIGVLGVGSSLQNEEAQDALYALNLMIASWSTEGALIYTETKETFNLTGAQSYTIGSSQDFDTTVPKKIVAGHVTYSGFDYPVQIIDQTEYNDIADKDLVEIPDKIYFDGNYPTANIYVYPVGYTSTTLTLYTQKPLTGFASLDTDFAMPPEYERALVYNLAVEVAPEFDHEPSATVKRIASSSLKLIKGQNQKNNKKTIKVDGYLMNRGAYNIYTGRYR